MYSYLAYGLTICSTIRLPELIEATGQTDVTIHIGAAGGTPGETRETDCHIHATANEIQLAWPDVGAFVARNGCEIIVDPVPGVEERVLRLFILGTTLAMLLHQRGDVIVLHASAVAIDGQVVAFIGEKGAGKSTTVAALQQRGHELLADDILALRFDGAYYWAPPGFPHLKLWPDTVTSLGYDVAMLPKLRPELDKRGYRIANGFRHMPARLAAIYVLDHGAQPEIQQLAPRAAWLELMPHWYGARFGFELLRALGQDIHFRQCADLAGRVPIALLKRPRDMAAMPCVAHLVENMVVHRDR
jgi:hypothetical protein